MADPVGDIIGDYRAFAAQQHDRLLTRGIDIRPYPLSHLAFRVRSGISMSMCGRCSNVTRPRAPRASGTADPSP
jgi:hypothetical protein